MLSIKKGGEARDMRNLSLHQTIIACVGLAGITLLAALGKVGGEVVSVIYTAVIAGALGYVNGKKAEAVKRGVEDAEA